MKHKKAQVGLYITWFILAIIIIVITGVLAPMGVLFNTEMLKAGEFILLQANDSIQGIQNASIQASVQDMLDESMAAAENNIEVNSDLFQYSWILVLVVTGLVIFIATRRSVEFTSRGGFV